VAQAIHQLSPVSQQRLAVCNCSAMVDTLLDSQPFGHVRGAFTGATEMRPGLFECADGGTVFLDEVGETSLATQAKLLRVIQNREVQRVGSPEVRHVNVRLIAATNRDLRGEALAGRFREDLFYRLSSIQIRVPSLTERLEDIPLLVHPWPGNVRELENVISSASITTTGELHRPSGFAGKSSTPREAYSGRRRVAAAFAGRSSQGAYSTGAGDVHGEPLKGCASVGHRAHEFVPLPETGSGRTGFAGKAARSGCGRSGARLIWCAVYVGTG